MSLQETIIDLRAENKLLEEIPDEK